MEIRTNEASTFSYLLEFVYNIIHLQFIHLSEKNVEKRSMRIETGEGEQIPRVVACRHLASRLWRAHPNNLTRPIIRLLKSRSCPADRLACIINRPSIVPCSPLNTWNLARNTIDPNSKLHPRAVCKERDARKHVYPYLVFPQLFKIKSSNGISFLGTGRRAKRRIDSRKFG